MLPLKQSIGYTVPGRARGKMCAECLSDLPPQTPIRTTAMPSQKLQ